MKYRTLKIFAYFLIILGVTQIPIAYAKCIDVLRPGELPSEITSQNGVKLTYSYRFEEDETYFISWARGSVSGGPIGPFHLQPSCQIPRIYDESNEFILLEKGCGSFCWYVDVLGLISSSESNTGSYESVERPLAFDAVRNLLAHYPRKDFIAIKNLLTGYEQVFPTKNVCQSGSGLCFSDITIRSNSLEYSWESNGIDAGEIISQPLDEGLIAQ